MSIPVFHDDQHGTAIIVAAAVLNGLKIVGKNIAGEAGRIGGRAAALACLELLVRLGLPLANITICDIEGVVYAGRGVAMDADKSALCARDLGAHAGRDRCRRRYLLGLSAVVF
jgi:malate dehydrogenase (oxaloacetate-decarboxylating)(NADP+)